MADGGSMSILINGMKMPKDREIYLRIDEKGEVYVYGSYPTELYKAVPVPPHGRLIDADELETDLKRQCKEVFRTDAVSPDDYRLNSSKGVLSIFMGMENPFSIYTIFI